MDNIQSNYETHNQELLAIVESFKHWCHYLESAQHEVLVLTNHHNLKKFIETMRLSPPQIRWAQELSWYNFKINFKQDKKNPADVLSYYSNLMHKNNDAHEENNRILHHLQELFRLSTNAWSIIQLPLNNLLLSNSLLLLHSIEYKPVETQQVINVS